MTDLRVLVVDDEPEVAAGHAAYVRRVPGFEMVGTAGTVQAAVAVLTRQSVDLVLLDLNLPDGHGLDVVRGIRAAGRPIDILAITAAREVEHVRSALALGVVGYLLKPFTFADLRDRLEAYRRYREGLAATTSASQTAIDAMVGELRRPATAGAPPKGLAREVLDAVIDTLTAAHPAALSASEVADAVGASRVTARRYLQYLADEGRVARAQRLGGSGRPEVTFAWRR